VILIHVFRIQPEDPRQAWGFFVNHYQDEIQARRDHKFSYRFKNGSYYVGTDPPEGVEP
jgi:choline dehydrogenase